MIFAIRLKKGDLFVLLLIKLPHRNFLCPLLHLHSFLLIYVLDSLYPLRNNLFVGGLYTFDFQEFPRKLIILLFDPGGLDAEIGVVGEHMVEFIVDGEMVGPHLVMQILVIFFYFGHLCILILLLDSSANRFF